VVDQLLADEQVTSLSSAGSVIWPLADHLGTIRDLATHNSSNHTTTIANHRVYDAFGNLQSETNSAIDEIFGFTGRQFDDATGLQNNLNRWYDSKTGRFVSEDPIGFGGGDSNLSRYVGNSPTHFVDPSGLKWAGPASVGGKPPGGPGAPGPGDNWLDYYGNWMNYGDWLGSCNPIPADAKDQTLIVGTVVVAIPAGIGIFAGGEWLLGIGTVGGAMKPTPPPAPQTPPSGPPTTVDWKPRPDFPCPERWRVPRDKLPPDAPTWMSENWWKLRYPDLPYPEPWKLFPFGK
jgi:RHS repeat-associated protein